MGPFTFGVSPHIRLELPPITLFPPLTCHARRHFPFSRVRWFSEALSCSRSAHRHLRRAGEAVAAVAVAEVGAVVVVAVVPRSLQWTG